MSKDERSEFDKIIDMLYVIHCENKVIAEYVLMNSCYPKEFERAKRNLEENWDRGFFKAIGTKNEKK